MELGTSTTDKISSDYASVTPTHTFLVHSTRHSNNSLTHILFRTAFVVKMMTDYKKL